MTTNEKALLAVSFGTSYPDTRAKTIDAIEEDLAKAFPDRRFYRAWTSPTIRRKLKERDGELIMSPAEALEKIAADRIRDVLVQASILIMGEEFRKLSETARGFSSRFGRLALGAPLLAGEDDVRDLAKILETAYPAEEEGALLAFMGHGSPVSGLKAYKALTRRFEEDGFPNIILGTVEFEPGIEPLLAALKAKRPSRVYLAPLLIVAGDHARNDMAGEEDVSWRRRLEKEGFEVTWSLEGMGLWEEIAALYRAHAEECLGR